MYLALIEGDLYAGIASPVEGCVRTHCHDFGSGRLDDELEARIESCPNRAAENYHLVIS